MASRKAASTKQVNVRLGRPLVDWTEAYRNSHPFRPTWTQIVEAALGDWLAKNAAQHKPKPAK